MIPRVKNLKIMRGDDTDIIIRAKHRDGTHFNFAGCRVDLSAKINITDETPALSLSTETGEIKPLEGGEIAVTIPKLKTAGQNWQKASYDLQITTAEGKVRTILCGEIELIHDITE